MVRFRKDEDDDISFPSLFVRKKKAAMEMMKVSVAWPDGTELQYRVGLHAGPVVAGIIGKTRLQYDVWGDTVNVASRMESNGEPGRIHVSSDFVSTFDDTTQFEERGEIDVKGKGLMKTYWVRQS